MHRGLPVSILEEMRGRHLVHALEHRARRDDVFVGQELVERDRIELARHFRTNQQRFDFRCEQQALRGLGPVERLLAGAVAGGDQGPRSTVPDRQREHASQADQEILAPLLVGVHEDFDVGVSRMKAVAVPLELVLQLAEVVDLTVGDDLDVAGLVQDRLLAARQVDDGQAAHAKADPGQRDAALFVRAAMMQHLHHAREILRRYRPFEITLDDADDATHL